MFRTCQISFECTADLKKVEEDLKKFIDAHPGYSYGHSFLPRSVVKDKNLPTDIVDMLERVAKEKKVSMTGYIAEDDLEGIVVNSTHYNETLDELVHYSREHFSAYDIHLVLGTNLSRGLKEEISVSSNGAVIFM